MSAWWMLWQKNGDLLPTKAVCKCASKCEAGSHLWPQGQQLNLPSLPSARSRVRKEGRSQDVTQERSQGSYTDRQSRSNGCPPEVKAGWIPKVPGFGAWGQDQSLIFGEGYFYRIEDYEGGTSL